MRHTTSNNPTGRSGAKMNPPVLAPLQRPLQPTRHNITSSIFLPRSGKRYIGICASRYHLGHHNIPPHAIQHSGGPCDLSLAGLPPRISPASEYCGRDRGVPKSRLYDWEGMATMGRQNPETRWVESLHSYLSVCPRYL
jgi:hypothetical protein